MNPFADYDPVRMPSPRLVKALIREAATQAARLVGIENRAVSALIQTEVLIDADPAFSEAQRRNEQDARAFVAFAERIASTVNSASPDSKEEGKTGNLGHD